MENESGQNEINSNKSLESSMNSTTESFKSQLSFKDEALTENIKIIRKYTEDLKNYCKNSNNTISLIEKELDNQLLLYVKFYKFTNLNPFIDNIVFLIVIDLEDFPNTNPFLKCLSNFTYPTLFDNRNLLFSVISSNYIMKISFVEIVENIPIFLQRIYENNENKIMVYYGDYSIDSIYEMNDFMANRELNFYKVNQTYFSGNKQVNKNRYVILTDLFFLLFDPEPNNLNLGKLLFLGDIRQLSSSKGHDDHSNHLVVEYRNMIDNSVNISFELCFKEENFQKFIDVFSFKINKLKESFKIFHDELCRNSQEKRILDFDKLYLLIDLKEKIIKKKYSLNVVKELASLYQSMIEVLAEKEDKSLIKIYLDKFKNILENDEYQMLIEKEKERETFKLNKKKSSNYELSKSYFSST